MKKKKGENIDTFENVFLVLVGGIVGFPIGLLGGFGYGLIEQIEIVRDILKLKEVKKELKNEFNAKISNEDKKLIIENLKILYILKIIKLFVLSNLHKILLLQ